MNSEQRVFLSLLKDHVKQTISSFPHEEINWEKLYEYAKQQALMGVCYAQLKKYRDSGIHIPDNVLDQFQKGFFNDVYIAANHEAEAKELYDEFNKKSIVYILFKGWIIKDFWPYPELRTMSDIDMLIHTEDRETSNTLMESLFYNRYIDNHSVWTYYKKDMVVEIHDHMFYEHLVSDIDYKDYFDQAWKYAGSKLEDSFHFLYLIAHLAKHTINNGMGFRTFMDLIFFCLGANKRMNWDWIHDELEKLKLLHFAETCFAFCQEWFDFESPLAAKQLDPDFFTFVTDKVFEDGIFGLENSQNEASRSAKEIAYVDAPYFTGAFKLTMHRLFPPYDEMRLVPWYSFVDGRPWMLPFAWVYRWGYCIIHKKERSKNLLEEPFAKKSVIEERQRLIHDWGL